MLWGRAAGKCEFPGCNRPVSWHSHTKETVNIADAAHIIGFSEDGPRGETELSKELAQDIENLMLLCTECHLTIDKNRSRYPVDFLRKMKKEHEERIELATSVGPERKSTVVLYGANVGEHSSPLTYEKAVHAMFPDWYPAERIAIELGMKNSSFRDNTPEFWKIEEKNIRTLFKRRVQERLDNSEISHLSVFGFAPQPLLILFGFLLSDIPTTRTYQLHREPPDWRWQLTKEYQKYIVEDPESYDNKPALVLALSATVIDQRIKDTLGNDVDIWKITIQKPHNDFLKSEFQLIEFRKTIRKLLDVIKSKHGQHAKLHIFPVAPVAIAVEFGRIIMPKADLNMIIYDENKKEGGFMYSLELDLTI